MKLQAMKLVSGTGGRRERPHAASGSILLLPLGNHWESGKLYIYILTLHFSFTVSKSIKSANTGANGKYFIINKFNLLSALH